LEAAVDEIGHVYEELRRTARALLRRERADHTLESVELVNQAWTRLLVGDLADAARNDPRSVIAAAVLHMRRALVDHARRRSAGRRPDPRRRVELGDAPGMAEDDPHLLLEIDRLLDALGSGDSDLRLHHGPRRAESARLALYAGLTEIEISELTGVPKSTVGNDLRFTRAWLIARLQGST
jgi:RNA polymerase sigma factor (TIGR02999 family)